MRQPTATDRGIVLMKFVLGLLGTKPEGMRPQDIYREVEAKVTLDEFDKEIMKGSGLPRWRAVLHFQSVAASKAGLLVKSDGQWHITDEGQTQAALAPDELKKLLRSRYREWRWEARSRTPRESDEPIVAAEAAAEEAVPPTAPVLFEDAKQKARAEIGLFVSTGGFTKDARRQAGDGSIHIELVDLDRFLELWLQHYDKIPQIAKAKLRLEPVYFLAPEIG